MEGLARKGGRRCFRRRQRHGTARGRREVAARRDRRADVLEGALSRLDWLHLGFPLSDSRMLRGCWPLRAARPGGGMSKY
jgi:hypothetical protein